MDIAVLAARHFEEHKRPLRIAVDEACWRYLFFLKPKKVAEIRLSKLDWPRCGCIMLTILYPRMPPRKPQREEHTPARPPTAKAEHPTGFRFRRPQQTEEERHVPPRDK